MEMEDVPVGFGQMGFGQLGVAGYKSWADGASYSTQKRASKSNTNRGGGSP